MNKTEALARLAAIEKETKQLRAIIGVPEKKASLIAPVIPGSMSPYWAISAPRGYIEVATGKAHASSGLVSLYGTAFTTEKEAAAYADALQVLLDLRRQPGSEKVIEKKTQYSIAMTTPPAELEVQAIASKLVKLQRAVPWFGTKDDAEAAIEAVGKDRILAMFKTLHGLE